MSRYRPLPECVSDRLFFRTFPQRRCRVRRALLHERKEAAAAGWGAPRKNLQLCMAVGQISPFLRMRAFVWFPAATRVEKIDEGDAQTVFESLVDTAQVAAVVAQVEAIFARTPQHLRRQFHEHFRGPASVFTVEVIGDDGLAGGVQ